MKINPFGTQGINPYKKQLNKVESASKSVSNKSDKVEISAAAKDLQGVSQVAVQRQEKVDQLKIQVENGTYKVDAKETAKGLVDFYRKN